MIVKNLKILRTYPFEDYLKLPGRSHSDIKSDGKAKFVPTAKMQLGTDVHNYLMTPEEYHHENRDIVRPLALEIKKHLGLLWKYLEAELAITADFEHEGFVLKYKGRIDLGIVGRLTIDIKVSDVPLSIGTERFGYDNQQSGYALSIAAPVALIVRISPKSLLAKKPLIETYNVPIKKDWWEYQIIQKGEPML